MKKIISTSFLAQTEILIPRLQGGWSCKTVLVSMANIGDTVFCETYQTPACKTEDTYVRLYFPIKNERIHVSFDNFGRLVASGSLGLKK